MRERIIDMLQHLVWAVTVEGADPDRLQPQYDALLAQLDALGPDSLDQAVMAA